MLSLKVTDLAILQKRRILHSRVMTLKSVEIVAVEHLSLFRRHRRHHNRGVGPDH